MMFSNFCMWLEARGVSAGEEFQTDSNGRAMQPRRRNARPTFTPNITEPVATNFYPITSLATLSGTLPATAASSAPSSSDAASSANTQSAAQSGRPGVDAGADGEAEANSEGREVTMALVTDRAQAAASLESGSLHLLLHRRLLQVRATFVFPRSSVASGTHP